MKINDNLKFFIKELLKHTPFNIISIGSYLRGLYFWIYIKKIPITKFDKILDAGCGEGDYAKNLAKKYPHLKIDAYDIKKYLTWNIKQKSVNFKQMDLLKLKEIEYYDFCYSIDVLEHIPGNYKVMHRLYMALKPGGYLFLHVPNRLQRRILPEKFFIEHENWGKHEHIGEMYSLKKLKLVLISVGFKIVVSHETFGFFGKIAWEIDIIMCKNIILRILFKPILKMLAYLDLFDQQHKKGNGILILAKK